MSILYLMAFLVLFDMSNNLLKGGPPTGEKHERTPIANETLKCLLRATCHLDWIRPMP